MKYYIIAGERSGDLHASNLMKALKNKDKDAEFRFFGGDYMQAVGGTLVVHYSELAFMGFWEVIKNLITINKYIKLCKHDINNFKPDVIILVDYAGFNLKIAKYSKKQGYSVHYYISPKIWAWNQKRALKIKTRVDKMYAILPFEVDFYQKYNWNDVSYVGNPVVESVNNHIVNSRFKEDYNLDSSSKIIAVLPGSRKQEIQYILPAIKEVINNNPDLQFCIAAVKSLPKDIYSSTALLENSTLIFDNTYNLLAHADAAIVTSGTATLETALWKVPQVVVYKANWASYSIAKALVKVNYISLVNLIIGSETVKELIQSDCSSENIIRELKELLKTGTNYASLEAKLGNKVASDETAKLISEYLGESDN